VGVTGPEERLLQLGGGLAALHHAEHERPAGLDGHDGEQEDAGEVQGGIGEFHVDSVYHGM
jgi:hypothetical protein